MTIGRKLSIGLGIMLGLVLVMGVIFFLTVKQVQNAEAKNEEMMELNTMLSERMVDHYKWVDGITSGIFIQGKQFTGKLDPDECNLGKWMASFKSYSKEIETPFKAMDAPHRKLHGTAEKYFQPLSGPKE